MSRRKSSWFNAVVLLVLGMGASGCSQSTGLASSPAATFSNPVLPSGPDPWVFRDHDHYYYTHTLGDRITLWRTGDVTRLAEAEQRTVWTRPSAGANAHSIWAPELHRIGGKWYLYYSATAAGHKDDAHRGVFVLENASRDPMQGAWIDRGRVNTRRAGIDGTVFQHRGALYFAYSPYIGSVSGIAVARMENPWTITGEEVVIAEPDKDWETQGGRSILEGPEFLVSPSGQIYMTYSAGACWSDNYALGLLSARPGADLVSRESWSKKPQPVLSSANGIYATGHNGFFRSPDGKEQWIVYHANPAAGMGCTAKRAPHLGRIDWTTNGEPRFPRPSPPDARLRKPSGTR